MKLLAYVLVLALALPAALASANANVVEDATPLVKRGLRDESTSLAGAAGNEEKVCHFLFWPFQC
jgi:hypothetical protein